MQCLPRRHGDTEARLERFCAPPCLRVSVVLLFLSSIALAAPKLMEVPLADVKLMGGFWAAKLETNRTVTVWHNFKMCEQTGRIANFARAAGIEKGPHQGAFFNDSDVYKTIEGAS